MNETVVTNNDVTSVIRSAGHHVVATSSNHHIRTITNFDHVVMTFDRTVEYLKTREQFGQVIGSFQSLGHRAATLFMDMEFARSCVEAALRAIDADDPDSWQDALRNNTRAIYLESLGNPLIDIPDLDAAVRFARAHELVSVVDNTFASPVNYRPLQHGFDLSLHSATKYLNGHTDIVAGAVIGSAPLVERIRNASRRFGGSLDPHTCYLLHRGIKTMVLRVHRQNENTLALARFLEAHNGVRTVNYPGLESHPQHARAQRWFDGCGGVLSFEIKGDGAQAAEVVRRLEMCIIAPSLGGVETLVTVPVVTSHAAMSSEQRNALGIRDSLIRVAVGIEDATDIIADFDQALAVL